MISNEEIRRVLAGNRFEMSGYNNYSSGRNRNHGERGSCVVHNTELLLRFAKYGLYEHFNFLYLDFYKGTPIIYYQYWNDEVMHVNDQYSGYTTTEIIFKIFEIAEESYQLEKTKRRVNE
jgi:hypothetical protein